MTEEMKIHLKMPGPPPGARIITHCDCKTSAMLQLKTNHLVIDGKSEGDKGL